MKRVTLSLVSHTNVGKTTLARTLLRRDVGEVLDQAHVTEVSEAHSLIDVEDGELLLWDTPGFGDSTRLLSRLKRHGKPILWFLQQTWDRVTDRPLWSSQQAVLNIQQEADVVLYLVNASEEPAEAGYVNPELDILEWMGRPVVVLLNQTGGAATDHDLRAERRAVWERHMGRWQVVEAVLELDAFSRSWVQESLLLDRVRALLPIDKQPLMAKLKQAWDERNLEVFERSVELMASYLSRAARDREELPSKRPGRADKKRAMSTLGERLVGETERLMAALLAAHALEGEAAVEIESEVDAYEVEGDDYLDPERSALVGGVVSGALGGLAADLLAGGLTFGGGMVAGALLGALGGAGLARGYEMVRGDTLPAVGWSPAFLNWLAAQTLARYLAVAHFGRGRGEYKAGKEARRGGAAGHAELRHEARAWGLAWKDAARGGAASEAPNPGLARRLDRAARRLLAAGYPEAAALLGVREPTRLAVLADPDDGPRENE